MVWGSLTIQNTNFLHSKNYFDFKSLALITGSFISCVNISQVSITNSSFITDSLVATHPIMSLSDITSLHTDQLTTTQCPVGSELHKVYEEDSKYRGSLTI